MSLVRRLLWRTRLRAGGETLDKFDQLREMQGLNKATFESVQKDRLKALLVHAYRQVPYYQELFETHDLVVKGEVDLERFTHLPLLDKDILRTQGERLHSADLSTRSWFEDTSGGSTGEPVRFIQDADYHEWMMATKLLFDEWTGYRPGDRKVKLWGSERDLLVGNETLKTYLGRYLRNEETLNTFRMSPDEMRDYVQTINTFKPKQILAYVESAFELARFVEREGLEVYAPGAVMTSAGTLHDDVREKLETVFRAPVFNRYGSREVGDIACTYPNRTELYIAPTQHVEILNDDGSPTPPGEMGEVVVTLLSNFAMPLIRYRIGDTAIRAADARAGALAWSALETVTGRVTDTFLSADGTQVNGEYFTHLFYFRDWVRKFQVVQEAYDQITVKIVPHSPTFERGNVADELAAIERDVQVAMGECGVTFDFVEDIPPTASGKYRYTISKVTRAAKEQGLR